MAAERVVDGGREREIGRALRAEWRMIERVALRPRGDGDGLTAAIHLNPTLVRGAAEQQGLLNSPVAAETAWMRRQQLVAECVDRLNAVLPPAESIREFHLV